MQDYYIVRQPMPFTGGMPGSFQGMPFMPPGLAPGFFPGQGPGFPPGQGPGFPPGQGPGFPPSGGEAGMGPPSGRPPAFVPPLSAAQQTQGVFAVNPGVIRPCRFRYTYVWLNNGQQFWIWPVFIGRDSLSGWRWTGFSWVFFGIDLNRISSFVCY